jgi:hypothetical protein
MDEPRSKATLNTPGSVIQEENSGEIDDDSIPDPVGRGVHVSHMPDSGSETLETPLKESSVWEAISLREKKVSNTSIHEISHNKNLAVAKIEKLNQKITNKVRRLSLPIKVELIQLERPKRNDLPLGKDVFMRLADTNLTMKSLTPNRLQRQAITPTVDCVSDTKLGSKGYFSRKTKTELSLQPFTENPVMKSMLSNILNNIDTGIILLDSKLDGFYSNIEHVFTQETLSYSSVREVIDIDLLTENGIYNFKRIFQKDNVKELTVDLVSFQIVTKIYNYCKEKSSDPFEICLPELEDSIEEHR